MPRMFAALFCLLLAAPLAEAASANADAIRAAVVGNTIQGNMMLTGEYSEYYAADGSIHSKDYEGKWRIRDNDMCFKYGEEPSTCYQVEIDGDKVTWLKDGQADGTGTIVPGNPNKY